MKKIGELKNRFDQAELLTKKTAELKINIQNWNLQDISQENLVSSSLRVIKQGREGANTTIGNSQEVMEKLFVGAEESAKYGEKAAFDFSSETLNNLSPMEEKNFVKADSVKIFNYIEDFLNYVRSKNQDITFGLQFNKMLEKITLETTNGGNLKEEIVNYVLGFGAPIPGGGSVFYRLIEQPQFFSEIPKDIIDDFLKEYEMTYKVSTPNTGNMPVLFAPSSLYFLFVSLQAGISGKMIYRKTSPLLDKMGEKIFSDKLTIIDIPGMKSSGRRRFFDDEGITTSKKEIISGGILRNCIYDLEYANKLNKNAGNGLKEELFGGDINTPISPNLINPVIEPGKKSKNELISEMDEGILVNDIIGFHSSNYEQGHFSVQAHGFHIKEGKLQGRLQDVMIAGNIYDDFNNIISIGDKVYSTMKGYAPYILVDNVSVTGK